MSFLYHILLYFYSFAVRIFSFFNQKAKQWIDGRKNILQHIQSTVNLADEIVWFHCASLGEYEQAKPVIEKLKQHNPSFKILVTFFSPSGYEIRKNDPLLDYFFYLMIERTQRATLFLYISI